MNFLADIQRYAKKANLNMNDAVVAINSKITSDIIDATPVDSGRARGNWYATIGNYSNEVDLDKKDKSGMSTISKAQKIANGSAGVVFYLTNNLPYIYEIEYHGWSKIKAPKGMVRISIKNMKSALKG